MGGAVIWRALPLAILLLGLAVRVASGQEGPPEASRGGDWGPLSAALNGLEEGLERLPERIASGLWEYTGGQLLKLLAAAVGFLVALFRWLSRGALGDVNFFIQIPEPWVTLSALEGLRSRLVPVARAVGGLAGTLIVSRWVAGAAFDWPFPGWAVALVRLVTLAPLVAAAPVAMLGLIRAGNVLAAALFDPATGLPGLAAVPDLSAYDRLAAEGVASLVYFAVCCWLWWTRVQVVIGALLLFVSSPLAVACWVLPFAVPQWIARAWATLFIGVVAVQVLQALTLGIGAALVAANVVTGEVEGAGAGVVNLGLAAGLVAATCYLPRRVLGALVAHTPPGMGFVSAGLQAGLLLSGVGWGPGMLGPVAGAVRARVVGQRTVPTPTTAPWSAAPTGSSGPTAGPGAGTPAPTGRVGSLLGGQRPLLLPPPRP